MEEWKIERSGNKSNAKNRFKFFTISSRSILFRFKLKPVRFALCLPSGNDKPAGGLNSGLSLPKQYVPLNAFAAWRTAIRLPMKCSSPNNYPRRGALSHTRPSYFDSTLLIRIHPRVTVHCSPRTKRGRRKIDLQRGRLEGYESSSIIDENYVSNRIRSLQQACL